MKQRWVLILAAALTGFLLVGLGAFGGRVTAANASGAAAPTAELISVMQQREAAYRQLIEQANARLQQGQGSVDPSSAEHPVTPDQALLIATSVAGGTQVRTPELVDVQGVVAYEVVLTTGTYYVDATTGNLLVNTTSPIVTVVRGSRGEHEDSEHEHDDDD
jgi:uncharacterized membrane protein YkoI